MTYLQAIVSMRQALGRGKSNIQPVNKTFSLITKRGKIFVNVFQFSELVSQI